jgi:hypothetical protein
MELDTKEGIQPLTDAVDDALGSAKKDKFGTGV